MVGLDVHSFAQIKAVGGETLHTTVQMKLTTPCFPGFIYKPIQQFAAMPTAAMDIVRNEVIYLKEMSPG